MCRTIRRFGCLVSAFGVGAMIGWSSPSIATSTRSSLIRQPPSTLRRSSREPRLPAPRRPTRSTRAVYLARLKPNDPDNNKIITDIDLAPKSKGRVAVRRQLPDRHTDRSEHSASGLMVHAVPNRGGNAFSTNALLQGVTYVQSGWQGDLLTQCSPSPAIPYPCFDLNSGPYGSLNTTTGAFTPPQVPDVAGAAGRHELWRIMSCRCPWQTIKNGKQPITGKVYSHVCTGTNGCGLAVGSAPTSTAQLVIQGAGHLPRTSRQAWTRTRLSSGPYRPRPSQA